MKKRRIPLKHLPNSLRLLLFVVSCSIIFVISRFIFSHRQKEILSVSGTSTILAFKNYINDEIVNALRMAYSPSVIAYLSDPDDPQKKQEAFIEFEKRQKTFVSGLTFWISDKDLHYHSNGKYLYTLDKSDYGSYWYERTFSKNESYFFNVNYDKGLNNTYFWIDIPIYNGDGSRIGIAGTGIPLADFVNTIYKISNNQRMYLYNDYGEITGAKDQALAEKKTLISKIIPRTRSLYSYFPKTTIHGSTLTGEYIITPISEINWYLALYAPFTLHDFFENSVLPFFFFMLFWFVLLIIHTNHVYHVENDIITEQNKEIEMLNKSQNRFFASMSHEIRTPINTIIGLNEMTMRENISDEVAENTMNIQSASKMLLNLINDILDMSKIESGQMEITNDTYNTGDMLSDIVGMLWIRAKEKKLAFHIDVDPTLPVRLIGDEMRIKQVLINLLTNAIKYTKVGSVTLSIGYAAPRKNGENAHVTYTVTDTGSGIKKESLPYIFSAFKRVEEKQNRYIEGTGLGLSIVKQLVDLMGGTISVNSIYTEGSTFIVELPQKVASEEVVGAIQLETRHAMNHLRKGEGNFTAPEAKILVVDDNSVNLIVAKKLLRDTKAQVDTVTSGKEALEKTAKIAYDVIFMDHMMPEMDGIECLHAIQKQLGGLCQETPIIALTANAGSDTQMLYKKEGFDGYLLKPVTGAQLEEMLLTHLPRDIIRMSEGFIQQTGQTLRSEVHKKRRPIIITTDSVSDLPTEYIKANNVFTIPYYVHTAGGDFYDDLEIDSRSMLSFLDNGGGVALSREPSVEDYEHFFAKQLSDANNVIHISMTSRSSAGYANACEAAKTFGNVTVIDSKHLSSGMGLLVMEAVRMAREGESVENIQQVLNVLSEKVSTSFIVDDTKYMTRAGRLSPVVNNIAKALFLHPILTLKKGRLLPTGLLMGATDQVRAHYIRKVLKKKHTIDTSIVFITHAGLSGAELAEIERLVTKRVAFKKVICQKASSAVTANCGLGTVGIIFKMK